MAAIDFPSNPTLNQIYEADSGYKFQWDGTVWKNYYDPGAMGGVLRADIRDDLSPELGNHLDARSLNIDNVGIITANYFYGDGANLTNLPPSGQTVSEVTSSGTPVTSVTGTTILSFLNDDFNVVSMGNGQVRIESAGGGFAEIDGVSSSIYNSVQFQGSGITISRSSNTLTFSATLAGLTDTQSIGTATDGQVLKYSSSLGKWIPGDDAIDAGGEVGPDDYVEAAGYAYSSGYWSPTVNGAVTSLTGTSQLSAWIDGLNDVLGKLVPPAPPNLGGGNSGISTDTTDSIDGIFRICDFSPLVPYSGFPGNNLSIPGKHFRVRFSNGSKKAKMTSWVNHGPNTYADYKDENIGPGDSGIVIMWLMNSVTGGYTTNYDSVTRAKSWVTLTSSVNNGNYGAPTFLNPVSYPNGASVSASNAIISISNNRDAAEYYNDATDSDRSVNGRAITPGFHSIFDIDVQAANAGPTEGFNAPFIVHYRSSSNINDNEIYGETPNSSWTSNQDGSSYSPGSWYENTNNLSAPAISFGTVNNPTGFNPVKSSGVDHLPASVAFSYQVNLSRVTGDIYNLSEDPVTIAAGTICAGGEIQYSDLGGSIPARNLGVSSPVTYVYSNQVLANTFAKSSNPFGTHTILSPFGTGTGTPSYSDTVLLFSGNEAGKPNESNGTIEAAVGNTFQRCGAGSGADTPTMSTTGTAWNPNSLVQGYEAKIVGGEMGHSLLNYSTNHFPVSVGVNYSAHDATQYCQLEFIANSIQGFNLNITGTYSGLWVAMPNNTGAGPNGWMSGTQPGWNGWADCFTPFSGGRPGEGTLGGSTTAAPATGASGTVGVNFGTSSTANSTGNQTVFIRFKFTAGQKITGLSIS